MLEAILKRGTLVGIGVLIICIFGILAASRVPIQMIPDLDVRVVTVQTLWPGTTPQDIEKEIIIEQEEYLRNIPSLVRMISVARTGEAEIELEFPFGTNVNEALVMVNNALSQVPAYPENVDEPRLFATSFSQNAFMYFRIQPLPGNPAGIDMDYMRDFIDDYVRTQMERVPGVSQVELRGGAERQIQILVDPAKLAKRNISLTQLRNVIRERNQDFSAGDIDSGKRRYLLRTVGRFKDLQELEDMIIERRGDSIIRLGDLADIQLEHFEIRSKAYVDGEPIINVSVRRETGSNVIQIKNAMGPVIEEINENILMPSGMVMTLTTDDVRYVQAAVLNVWKNLALGALLATLVMYLFLRSTTATLVGVVGIPVCTIAAFLGLLLAGRTINVVSLAGVAFAIGMTVDNSIVVLESIEKLRRQGMDRFQAALQGVQNVWPAVLASTMTTILVFAPILFIQQEAGQLYSDIAIAISASIFISMLIAVMVIPALSCRFSFSRNPAPQHAGNTIKNGLLKSVNWLISRQSRCMGWVLLTLAGAWLVFVYLTPATEYLPEGEEPKSFSQMIAPPGYSLTEMSAIAEELHAELLPYVNTDPARFDNGEAAVPSLAYMILWIRPQQIRIIAETTNPGHIQPLMDILTERLGAYPGMRAFSARGSIISSNDGGTRSINVDISGPDLAEIYESALAVYRRTNEIFDRPQIRPEPPVLTLGQPLIELRPDWERAAELGLSASDIGYSFAALTDGAYVDEFFMADNKIDMFMYSNAGMNRELAELSDLPVYTPQGTVLPLSAVANIVETIDTDSIRRVNGRRTVSLFIIPQRSVPLETAAQMVRKDVIKYMQDNGQVPASVSMDISGASDQLEATKQALSTNFIVAVILCYLLLVAIFTHWGYPFIIMTSVPIGIAGGIIGLWFLNQAGAQLPVLGMTAIQQPLDMLTMLGFLILLGTVVNNPILIVDQTLVNIRAKGMAIQAAVLDAVDTRVRPITMSMFTTVFGLSPLVFLPGAGSELYRGIGIVVMSGLLFSTLITLTFLPSLLVLLLSWRQRKATI